jgi:Kelch motif protein/galactose oxidase-like protein
MTVADPEEVVARRLRRLATFANAEPSSPVDDVGDGGPSHRAAAVAAVAIVLALVGASLALLRASDHRVVAVGPAAAPGGTTELLAASGLSARRTAASVWTGHDLLVWGGSGPNGEPLADGAALDPSANRWRPLPPAPIGPRSDAAAVWTGTEMLVWGGSGGGETLADGAAFNPQTNRWRTIADQPFGGGTRSVAVWTGREMLVVSGFNAALVASAYDPRTDRWRRLATPEGALVMPYPQATWTGTQLVLLMWTSPTPILGGPGTPSPVATGVPPLPASAASPPLAPPSTLAARPAVDPSSPPPLVPAPLPVIKGPNSDMFLVSYSPSTDSWSRLPPVALKDGGLPRLAWTDHELLLLQSSAPGAAFDPARGTWRPLAAPPADGAVNANPVWTGKVALFWAAGSTGYAYDLARDAWSTYDAGGLARRIDAAVVAWTGEYLVGWGSFVDRATGAYENDGIRYRPPRS